MRPLKLTVEAFGPFAGKEIIDFTQIEDQQLFGIYGETGSGKELVAEALHIASGRQGTNISVNCAAIPSELLESELFGHVKGAFTGANQTRIGHFEAANGGTIFLDEIGDTPKNVQVKLLRVLENGEFFRVGSSKVQTTDVRVITATNKDLWQLVEEGTFQFYVCTVEKCFLYSLRCNEYPCIDGIDCVEISSSREN